MKIALGSDHRGTEAIDVVVGLLEAHHDVIDRFGACDGAESCDYPEPAYDVGLAVAEGRAERGILICGSGIGVSIAANKVPGVRAALVHDAHGAEMSRRHNNANVVCFSAALPPETVREIVEIFLATGFDGGRHERRVAKITAIEQGERLTSPA